MVKMTGKYFHLKLRAIELSSDSGDTAVKIAESAEPVANFEISADNLVENFELGLEVGKLRRDRFISLLSGDELEVGERVRVQLTSTVTPFS